ncbi:MAG: ADP-ribosylglycohydrolase family protein [bacterium]
MRMNDGTRSHVVNRPAGALLGMFIADALAMPVHWYYDRAALSRDYGLVDRFLEPHNPHPDSILHRSEYRVPGPDADILHDQARYWGRRGVHYHQFLEAGENTLNLKLLHRLLTRLAAGEAYDPDRYLEDMVEYLRTPGSHRDTYVEEWVRGFFQRRARGLPLDRCAPVEKHVGGLAGALGVLIWHSKDAARALSLAREHLRLTHAGPMMAAALEAVAGILLPVLEGRSLRESVSAARARDGLFLPGKDLLVREDRDDLEVIGRRLSPACYVGHAVPAAVYLAWKYHEDPRAGLIANTMAGGDNCYRGVVLGALLGAAGGPQVWPEEWAEGLLAPPPLPR